MATIAFQGLRHSYATGAAPQASFALSHVPIAFEDGGRFALLGSSGCGKTTLLNIISGLLRPSEGRVLFDGADVTDRPTEARNIAQVFQFPVVYEGLTVAENLAFPLRNRGVGREDARRRVAEILDMTGLAHMADRRARSLAPDEKQLVSLGRGLVRADVAAILFDEPLTVIDPQQKWRLRSRLKALHAQTGRTMIYVTHDQTEALTFADRVMVMHDGEVVQAGSPSDLFDSPEHTFVGYFIGSPGMNVLPVDVDGRNARIGGQSFELDGDPPGDLSGRLEIGVRPEHVQVGTTGLAIEVQRVEDLGRVRIVRARLEGHDLAAVLHEGEPLPADPRVTFAHGRAHLYRDSRRVALVGAGR
ncbi:ATP-binding cassette domain-containing protein [bacterium]|nr:ATP-binding cassette domain-containing protein [bacterium]